MDYGDFKNLTMAHMEELFAFALNLCASRVDAEDLVHNTYARAFERWRQLRHHDRSRAWLFQILRGIFINQRKRDRSAPSLHLVEDASREVIAEASTVPRLREAAEENLTEHLLAVDIRAALSRLPEDSQEITLLADVWGFDYKEIAEITEQPLGTVRSRLHRARSRLATELRNYAEERGYVRKRSRQGKADAQRGEP